MKTAVLFSVLCAAGCTAPNEDFVAEAARPTATDGAADAIPPEDGGAALDLAPFVSQPDLGALPDLVPPCGNTLAGVGAGDFTIRFRVITAVRLDVPQPLLAQRVACDGSAVFWAVETAANGSVNFITNNARIASNSPVNDGAPHDVMIVRRSGEGGLFVYIDGRPDAGPAPVAASYQAMPPLEIGESSACRTVARDVQVTHVCINVP